MPLPRNGDGGGGRTLLGGDGEMVDVLSVDIGDGLVAGEVAELLDAADDDHLLAVVADPDGDGGTPVSVSGDVPVDGVLQPVVESLLLDEGGDPVGLLVVGEKSVLDLGDVHEPAGNGSVDEGSIGSPAEGVAVLDGVLVDELSLGLQSLHDVLIAVLDVSALVVGNLGMRTAAKAYVAVELAVEVNGAGNIASTDDDAVGQADAVIILTKAGGAVDDTSTGVVGDVGIGDDSEGVGPVLEVVEEGDVLLADEVLADVGLEDLELTT